jgi:hypothetical protein
MARAQTALLRNAQTGLQIPHPARTLVNRFTQRTLGYPFADTYVHFEYLAISISKIIILKIMI